MLKIDINIIKKIYEAVELAELHFLVQSAIELEHATIPPYLTAMFSLHPQKNREIWDIIHSVVIEEMLHMSIAANILNALDGKPVINKPHFIPHYPSKLPFGIADYHTINLTKYTKEQVKEAFMAIEEPEHPIHFPRGVAALGAESLPDFGTIGAFYTAVKDQILNLCPGELPGNKDLQFTTSFFPESELFPIITGEDAARAIDIIIEQGEGMEHPQSPLDPEGELAHYYRFEELYEGRRLVEDPKAKHGYSFTGPEIPFDKDAVYNIFPNTKIDMIKEGTEERRQANQFAFVYSKLLNGLHRVFNGEQHLFNQTIALMFDLKLVADRLVAMDFPAKEGYKIGPTFEFVNQNL